MTTKKQPTNSKESAKDSNESEKSAQREIVYVQAQNSNQLLTTFLVFLVAVLVGILIQQNYLGKIEQNSIVSHANNGQQVSQPVQQETKLNVNDLYLEILDKLKREFELKQEPKVDIEKLYKEISVKVRKEIEPKQEELINSLNRKIEDLEKAAKQREEIVQKKSVVQDDIINETKESKIEEKKTISIDNKIVEDKSPEIKFENGQPIVIDSSQIKFKTDEIPELTKKPKTEKKVEPEIVKEKKKSKTSDIPDEVKNFSSKVISQIKPKKMWIPIPNSNGGHRRVPAIEVKAGKEHGSSVKVWLYEEFLSKEECENLIQAHESHLKELLKQKPIICFDSISTLKKNLIDLNREKIAEVVTPNDFTQGTMCLNQTFSRQLEKWGLKWSYSTAFYPGESKFSKIFGKRIEEATMLNETHGGKFQITSYPQDVGYKDHTDCVVDSKDQRDRYATFLVYLNDLGADGGGETIFTELGIDVKPRQGRALTWNNMNYDTGKCESKSTHTAAKVKHLVKKKYIIQRWYYYKNFYSLGKRMQEAQLPQRPPNTPKVSCDNYDYGSCRMYDEWNPDHMLDYQRDSKLY